MLCFFPSFFNPNPCCDIRTQKRLSGTPGLFKDPVLIQRSIRLKYTRGYYYYDDVVAGPGLTVRGEADEKTARLRPSLLLTLFTTHNNNIIIIL
jgi:hypothetical protein